VQWGGVPSSALMEACPSLLSSNRIVYYYSIWIQWVPYDTKYKIAVPLQFVAHKRLQLSNLFLLPGESIRGTNIPNFKFVRWIVFEVRWSVSIYIHSESVVFGFYMYSFYLYRQLVGIRYIFKLYSLLW